MLSVTKIFEFEAGHYLPNYIGKCGKMHGHRWILEVEYTGKVKNGMIMDYSDIKELINRHILDELDHSWLNDILDYPSSENLIMYIVKKLQVYDSGTIYLNRVKLWETSTSYCEWKRDE